MPRPPLGLSLVIALVAGPRALAAQTLWPTLSGTRAELGVEWTRIDLGNSSGSVVGQTGTILIAEGRYRFAPGRSLVVALPRLMADHGAMLGNPYIGVQQEDSSGSSLFIVGVRIPYADDGYAPPEVAAWRGDFNRFEQAVPNVATVHAEGQGRVWKDSGGADVRVRAGMTLLHNNQVQGADANTFLFDYGVRFGRGFGKFAATAALTGRFILSGDVGGVAERNLPHGELGLAWHGPLVASLGYRVPLTQQTKALYHSAWVAGVTLPIE